MPKELASWQTEGIAYVNDILNANGDFLRHTENGETFDVGWLICTGFTNQTKSATRVTIGDTDRVLTQAYERTFYSF